jgi:hypothetical protein
MDARSVRGSRLPITPRREVFTESLRLDFSHLGAWRSASAKASMNAPGTFCGSLAHTDPQKVSDLRRPRSPPPHASRRSGHGADTVLPRGSARSLRGWPISEPSAGFLAKTWQGAFASNSSALERPGNEDTALFHSQMAKVELIARPKSLEGSRAEASELGETGQGSTISVLSAT